MENLVNYLKNIKEGKQLSLVQSQCPFCNCTKQQTFLIYGEKQKFKCTNCRVYGNVKALEAYLYKKTDLTIE